MPQGAAYHSRWCDIACSAQDEGGGQSRCGGIIGAKVKLAKAEDRRGGSPSGGDGSAAELRHGATDRTSSEGRCDKEGVGNDRAKGREDAVGTGTS